MMDGESFLKISRFDNGYTVEIKDPAIVKYNDARTKTNNKPGSTYLEYKDPWKTFVFKDDKEVTTFLAKNLKKAIVKAKATDFESSFDTACVEGDD